MSRGSLLTILALGALAWPGCSSPPAGTRDAGGSFDAPIAPGTDAPGSDAPIAPGTDAPSSDAPSVDAPPAATLALCRIGCTTASDCTTASVAFDADNYDCAGGVCLYTGCNTDAECRTAFANPTYVCADTGGGIPFCTLGCTTDADCTTGTAAFDADNYTCVSGACRYDGCNTDAECATTFADSRYVCSDVPLAPIPGIPSGLRNCVLGCSASADCATASAAFDADNYTCSAGGACVYAGCNTAAECQSSFADARYVCD